MMPLRRRRLGSSLPSSAEICRREATLACGCARRLPRPRRNSWTESIHHRSTPMVWRGETHRLPEFLRRPHRGVHVHTARPPGGLSNHLRKTLRARSRGQFLAHPSRRNDGRWPLGAVSMNACASITRRGGAFSARSPVSGRPLRSFPGFCYGAARRTPGSGINVRPALIGKLRELGIPKT